jgi:hypothetical protein
MCDVYTVRRYNFRRIFTPILAGRDVGKECLSLDKRKEEGSYMHPKKYFSRLFLVSSVKMLDSSAPLPAMKISLHSLVASNLLNEKSRTY